ncbi:hypothetical protein BPC006_I1499 [Burkholderia pseudomallei BPC006]|nr:hypothetical protein BPC006_I1499 [Burkholderia pseudomallei BPC006]
MTRGAAAARLREPGPAAERAVGPGSLERVRRWLRCGNAAADERRAAAPHGAAARCPMPDARCGMPDAADVPKRRTRRSESVPVTGARRSAGAGLPDRRRAVRRARAASPASHATPTVRIAE